MGSSWARSRAISSPARGVGASVDKQVCGGGAECGCEFVHKRELRFSLSVLDQREVRPRFVDDPPDVIERH